MDQYWGPVEGKDTAVERGLHDLLLPDYDRAMGPLLVPSARMGSIIWRSDAQRTAVAMGFALKPSQSMLQSNTAFDYYHGKPTLCVSDIVVSCPLPIQGILAQPLSMSPDEMAELFTRNQRYIDSSLLPATRLYQDQTKDLWKRVSVPKRDARSTILTLRVEMSHLIPTVWRRVTAPAHITLHELHDRLLAPAMGWSRGYHSYAFRPVSWAGDCAWFGPTKVRHDRKMYILREREREREGEGDRHSDRDKRQRARRERAEIETERELCGCA